MQRIRGAPVLSAPFNRVSFGITAYSPRSSCTRRVHSPFGCASLCPLHDLDEPPPLGLRQRTGLDDPDEIALVGVVARVVRVQRRRRAHDLLVAAVPAGDLDADGDRLVGLVGDDPAEALLRAPGGRLMDGGERRLGGPGRGRLGPLALLGAPAAALVGLALALRVAVGLALLRRARGAL